MIKREGLTMRGYPYSYWERDDPIDDQARPSDWVASLPLQADGTRQWPPPPSPSMMRKPTLFQSIRVREPVVYPSRPVTRAEIADAILAGLRRRRDNA